MELREYALILRKNWVLVVVFAFLGLGVGAVATLLLKPQYESQSQVYVSVSANGGDTGTLVQGADYSRQIVTSYVDVVRTGVVLDPVVEQLGLDITADELASHVTADSPPESALINITATSPSAEQAALIANSVVGSFGEAVRTQLEPEFEGGGSPIRLTTTQTALVPDEPISPNVMMNLALGILVGIAAGFGIAVFRTMMDRRIYSLQEIEQVTEKPVLGEIFNDQHPEKNRLVVNSMPQSTAAEAFRALRTNLQFLNAGSKHRVFVLTSPNPGEGKSTTSLNLALALSQTSSRVAVVEGDLRRPTFSEYLGIEGGAGLTDVLIGRADLDDVLQRWGKNEFYVLPAGRIPPNPSELLGSTEMENTLATLREDFDYVIIDAPPAIAVTDAAVLGKLSAGLLMVVASGSTTKPELEDALRTMETAGADILGIVATMMPLKGADSYGKYRYRADPKPDMVESEPEPKPESKPESKPEPKLPSPAYHRLEG